MRVKADPKAILLRLHQEDVAWHRRSHGLVELPPTFAWVVRIVERVWLAAAVSLWLYFGATVGIPANPDGTGFGAQIERPLQLGLIVVAVLGGVLAVRWVGLGATFMAVAALGLGFVASVAYPPSTSIAMTAVFGVPSFLAWLAWQHTTHRMTIAGLALLAAVLLGGEWTGASALYNYYFGPTHPQSDLVALPEDKVEWVWSGAVTSEGGTVVARVDPDARAARLRVTDGSGKKFVSAAAPVEDGLARMPIDGLDAYEKYEYRVEVDGEIDEGRGRGSFTTFPDGTASFTLAVGSCARTNSNGAVFEAIAAANPLLYLIAGDVHYRNIESTRTSAFLNAFDGVLTAPAQAALYRNVPVDYVWDDHDYGPNDADGTSPGRPAALAAYRAAVPHAPLAEQPDAGIYHAFDIGRVRVVVSDTRSERRNGQMISDAQFAFLAAEFARADDYALVIWVNPDPWIAPAAAGADHWGGYSEQRREIADVIAAAEVDNLLMVSGDAHMLAIDDGSHSDYSSDGGAGFPILHAAALDRRGSVKGGPYSHGAFPGSGQFGLVRIDDTGDRVKVGLEGRDWDGNRIVDYSFEVPVDEGLPR